jgi:hypothetical protein
VPFYCSNTSSKIEMSMLLQCKDEAKSCRDTQSQNMEHRKQAKQEINGTYHVSTVLLIQVDLSTVVKPNRNFVVVSRLPKLEPEVVTTRADNIARFGACKSRLGMSKVIASVNVDTQRSIDMTEECVAMMPAGKRLKHAVSAFHSVASAAVTPERVMTVASAPANPEPYTVMLADPVAG